MNRNQAVAAVTEVAVWAREHVSHDQIVPGSCSSCSSWRDLADAADDLAVMLEADTFARPHG